MCQHKYIQIIQEEMSTSSLSNVAQGYWSDRGVWVKSTSPPVITTPSVFCFKKQMFNYSGGFGTEKTFNFSAKACICRL